MNFYQHFSANRRSANQFFIEVDNEDFLENVKPAFFKAVAKPTPENVSAMIVTARQHSPSDRDQPNKGRRLLAHALWTTRKHRNIGLPAQDKVAKGIGSDFARKAAVSAMCEVIKLVQSGYKPSHRGL